MHSHKLNRLLRNLSKEGKQLLRRNGEPGDLKTDFALWHAAASDVLRASLPSDSALLGKFDEAVQIAFQDRKKVDQSISQCLEVLQKAQTLSQANLSDPEGNDFEREARLIIGDVFVRSPWFYIPVIVLLITIGFAIAGVVKIQDVQVDLADIAKKSISEAKAEIEKQAAEILGDLDGLYEAEKSRIDTKVGEILDSLSPNLEARVSKINNNLEVASDDVQDINSRVTELLNQTKKLEAASQRLRSEKGIETLRGLSAALNRSQAFLTIIVIFVAISALLSGYTLYRLKKFRQFLKNRT